MGARRSRADTVFKALLFLLASSTVFLTLLFFYEPTTHSSLTLGEGFAFILSSEWNPVGNFYDVLLIVHGSVVTSAMILLTAVPMSGCHLLPHPHDHGI
jgi:ABC-type phosphate transport system permease subunit